MTERSPLVINYRQPRYTQFLCAMAGVLIGWGGTSLIVGPRVLGGVFLAIGVAMGLWWWFAIASDEACSRRYNRARIAAIHKRDAQVQR